MKYVHITPCKNISRINKNGIRVSKKCAAVGVYAVPLTEIQYSNYWSQRLVIENDQDQESYVGRHSSWRLWHWWSRKPFYDERGKLPNRSAAIVFSAPEDH